MSTLAGNQIRASIPRMVAALEAAIAPDTLTERERLLIGSLGDGIAQGMDHLSAMIEERDRAATFAAIRRAALVARDYETFPCDETRWRTSHAANKMRAEAIRKAIRQAINTEPAS